MNELIPTIKIGKRYLYRHHATEATCPHCGYIFGTRTAPYESIVTILAVAGDARCPECKKVVPLNGWYGTDAFNRKGLPLAVPYTQLSEIEGETYDRNMAIS